MPRPISRADYAAMFGPTTGDRVRLGDTDLIIEVERDLIAERGGYGDEVKFGGGKVIRDGMGQSQVTRADGRDGHGDHQRADRRLERDREGRCRAEGRADREDRQGGQPRYSAGRRRHHRAGDRDHRGRGQDPDRRRVRRPYPFHRAAADRRCAAFGADDDAGRRHRPGAWHARHHLHAGALAHRADAAGGRCLPDEPRLCRQGQCQPAGGAGRAGAGRRGCAEAARGLGDDARRHRLLPDASPTRWTCR